VVVQVLPVMMMTVASAKKPPIAGRTAISVLKQHMVKHPIFEAPNSRSEELFAAAIGTAKTIIA
jgi:hypothetical protein